MVQGIVTSSRLRHKFVYCLLLLISWTAVVIATNDSNYTMTTTTTNGKKHAPPRSGRRRNNTIAPSQRRRQRQEDKAGFLRDVILPSKERRRRDERSEDEHAKFMDSIMESAEPLAEYNARIVTQGGTPIDTPPQDREKQPTSSSSSSSSSSGNIPDFKIVGTQQSRSDGDTTTTTTSTTHRRLEDGDNGDNANNGEYSYYTNVVRDFSAYSFKYAKCQPIQRFSEEAAYNGEYSALVTDFMVVFRFCPVRRCNDANEWGCSVGYGEYVIKLENYVKAMLYYQADNRNKLCPFCEACGFTDDYLDQSGNRRRLEDANGYDDGGGDDGGGDANADDGDDANDDAYVNNDANNDAYTDDAADDTDDSTTTYSDECVTYSWLCNGYDNWCYSDNDDDAYANTLGLLDYLDYLECTNIESNDGRQSGYWIGPRCDDSTGKISMGLFYDPYCSQYAGNEVNLKDVSGVPFSSKTFYHMYHGKCLECSQEAVAPLYGTTHYLCNKLYSQSGKCNQYLAYSVDDDDATTDDANDANDAITTTSSTSDAASCSYIENIRYGGFDSEGQITGTTYSTSSPKVTIDQKVVMVVLSLTCLSLSLYSCVLHHEITNLLLHKLSYQGGLAPSKRASRGWGRRNRDSGRDAEEFSYASDDYSYA